MFVPAMREALGAPALAMAATFVAFGAAAASAGLPLAWALAASLLVYGMPGMMILVGGGGAMSAAAANARFVPMAVALAPWLGPRPSRRWLALPFIAVTPWAMAMRRLPGLEPGQRLPWFLGFGLASWLVGGAATWLGFSLAGSLERWALALLLLVNPLYFAVILAGEAMRPAGRAAALAGMACAPLVPLLPSSWGLLAAGVLGGTAAFLWRARRGR